MGIGQDLNDLKNLNNNAPPINTPYLPKYIPARVNVYEGPGTGADGGGGVNFSNDSTSENLQNGSYVVELDANGANTFASGYIDWPGDTWEDKWVDIDYYSPIAGKEINDHVHIGNNTSDAVLTYTIFPFLDNIPPTIKPSGDTSYGNVNIPSLPWVKVNNPKVPYLNCPYPDYSTQNYYAGQGTYNPLDTVPNWFNTQYNSYSKHRRDFLNNGLPDFLNPTYMYLGSQYYGQKIGEKVGGLFGNTGAYVGGKAGRFGGDVIGNIGAGITGLVEGAGSALGYTVATGNPNALTDEAIIQGEGLIDSLYSTGTTIIKGGSKLVDYAESGKNTFNDKDINNLIDSAGLITSFALPLKAGKAVKVRDISITKMENLGANPTYKKLTYGVGLYIKDKPIIGITKEPKLSVKTGGVSYPTYKLSKEGIYTAIDKYQVPHFKNTLKHVGIDTTRFDSGYKIAKTTYKSKQGVFQPTTFEIHSKNIPDVVKPVVIQTMKNYVKKYGDVEVYGSNVQKMQIKYYQTREVGDIEIGVQHPNKFGEILDKELQKSGIKNYIIKNKNTDAPKVYFNGNKGIEIFKHDKTPMAQMTNALKNDYDSDIRYGFKSLGYDTLDGFKIMKLPEQHVRKFEGGHVLRTDGTGQFELLPTHEGRYKDISDFVDTAVAYHHEKSITNAQDIINYVQSTPNHIANKVSSPIFHYIRRYGKIPSREEILKMGNNQEFTQTTLLDYENSKIDQTMQKMEIELPNARFENGEFKEKELLFKITKKDLSSSYSTKINKCIGKIDSNEFSSLGSLTIDTPNLDYYPSIVTGNNNSKKKNDKSSTSNSSKKKNDKSSTSNSSKKKNDKSSTSNSSKHKHIPSPIPPTTKPDINPYPPPIPPTTKPDTNPYPPPNNSVTPPFVPSNKPVTGRHTKRKKKDSNKAIVFPKLYKQGAAKTKRDWYVKDINKAMKDIEKQAKQLEKMIKF